MASSSSTSTSGAKATVVLEQVTTETLPVYAPRLGAMLSAQVLNGTSNNFLLPFTAAEATAVFSRVLPSLQIGNGPGGVVMWVARLPAGETPLDSTDIDGNPTGADDVIGSVQLAFHQAPNGRFRSEVRKLLVDQRYQRRGIGKKLMALLEEAAKAGGSTLCLLDTEQGGPGHALYTSMGWQTAGIVPNYAMVPDGSRKNGAVFMYKEL